MVQNSFPDTLTMVISVDCQHRPAGCTSDPTKPAPPRGPAAGPSSPIASRLRAAAWLLLVTALVLGVWYQLAPLKNSPVDLLCSNQRDTPTEVGHPGVDLLDAHYSLVPARLRCTWSIPETAETATRTYMMNTGVDAMTLTALLASLTLGVGSRVAGRRSDRGSSTA
jgi:hypothetical protein